MYSFKLMKVRAVIASVYDIRSVVCTQSCVVISVVETMRENNRVSRTDKFGYVTY